MASKRYRYFIIRAEHTPEMGEKMINMSKSAELHEDEKGPYHKVTMDKPATIDHMKKMTGCDGVTGIKLNKIFKAFDCCTGGEAVESDEDLLKMARSSVARAKREFESLSKKGNLIVKVLNEDNTPEDILSPADQKAIRAYKKSLK